MCLAGCQCSRGCVSLDVSVTASVSRLMSVLSRVCLAECQRHSERASQDVSIIGSVSRWSFHYSELSR